MKRARRDALRAGGVLGLSLLAGCQTVSNGGSGDGNGNGDGGAPGSGGTADGSDYRVETLADGFVSPVDVAVGGGETIVADQIGGLHRVTGDERDRERVLDLRESLVSLSGYEERGLLGVAFHPEVAESGTGAVFVYYSAPRRDGTPANYDHTSVLAAFDWTGERVEPTSERVLLEIPEPQANHNGGALAFGPDGYLYVGVGDGGGANDTGRGHVADWYEANAGGNGQDTASNRLGSVLRIDVDGEEAGRPYAIPPDNPLPESAHPEQYAWGFRNPWRLSVDDERLIVADVGQVRYEEVNVVVAGGNYGWNVREGRHCFSASSPSSPPSSCPSETPDGTALREPVIEYPHDGAAVSGVAVVGGHVYRGDALTALRGDYVFADWDASGRLFVATPTGETWSTQTLPVDGLPRYVTTFGRDAAGELLVCGNASGSVSGTSGSVGRLVPA